MLQKEGQEVRVPLQLQAGKLTSRSSTAHSVTGAKRPTLFVTDLFTHRVFLMDSGAEVSLLHADHTDRTQPPSGLSLVVANS